jgi:hypothetical protein
LGIVAERLPVAEQPVDLAGLQPHLFVLWMKKELALDLQLDSRLICCWIESLAQRMVYLDSLVGKRRENLVIVSLAAADLRRSKSRAVIPSINYGKIEIY